MSIRPARLALRLTAIFILLAPAAAGAQRDTAALALPDSTYLTLTLELPIAGSFTVSEQARNGAQERFALYSLSDVRIEGCTLIWRAMYRVHTDVRPRRSVYEIKVPLKALDPKRVGLRSLPMNGQWRPQISVMELYGYARNRGERPIQTRALEEGNFTTRSSQFAIPISDGDAARRMLSALQDAMQRCDTWNTKPLPVIRTP